MFAYCLNNPVLFFDDGGFKPKSFDETCDDIEDDIVFPVGNGDGTPGTTTIYRSVGYSEAADIERTGNFNLVPGSMECKQFGFCYDETQQFGQIMGQDIIVSADIPNEVINQFCTTSVDSTIFRSGTLTVYDDKLSFFNQLVRGSIRFMTTK